MIDRTLSLIGVDARQFRAMLRTSLRIDFRVGLFASGRKKKSRRRLPGLWQILVYYGLLGFVITALLLASSDLFFTGTVMMGFVMFSVATSILVEFQSVVIAPEDFHILAHRPVSSRTFFAARIANMGVYLGVLTFSIGFTPSLFLAFRDGFQPLLGIAAMLGMLGAAMFTAMAIVFLYVNLMRFIHPRKLKRFFSYLQLLLSFFLYGSGMIFTSLFNAGMITDVKLAHEVWMLYLPPTWFSSLMTLVDGQDIGLSIGSILVGMGITFVMLMYAYTTLSLEYAAVISRMDEQSEGKMATRRSRAVSLPMFTRNEGRAAALLIRNQFKHDQKFRMSVLAIIPLTVIYLLGGLSGGGGLADPFSHPEEHVSKAYLLYFALAFFPVLLMASMSRSDSWQASWIFHATPADKGKIVLAVKDVLVIFFIVPYVVGLGILFMFHFDSFQNVLLHVFILSVLSHIILQVLVMLNPYLPFSRPSRKGQKTIGIFVGILVSGVTMLIIISVLTLGIYPSGTATGITLLVLAGLTLLFERIAAERVRKKTRKLQFDQ